jgi:protein-arginine kinase activator protein McsA
MPNIPPDIRAPITNNETWNDCPRCHKSWKDDIATPGLLHRTRYCAECYRKLDNEVHGHMRKP